MRLHRFFIGDELDGKSEVAISDRELLGQWKKVFRLGAGDRVILLDGTGFEYEAEFLRLAKDEAVLAIRSRAAVGDSAKRGVVLLCSLIKKDNYEWVLQKGTELGAAGFVPVLSERSEKKDLNMERARKIVREASEQSGRGRLPDVYGVHELEDALEKFDGGFVAFDPSGDAFAASEFGGSGRLCALIGPEGGWSERELGLFKAKGIPVRSLGKQVLRAETAAVAVSALLLL